MWYKKRHSLSLPCLTFKIHWLRLTPPLWWSHPDVGWRFRWTSSTESWIKHLDVPKTCPLYFLNKIRRMFLLTIGVAILPSRYEAWISDCYVYNPLDINKYTDNYSVGWNANFVNYYPFWGVYYFYDGNRNHLRRLTYGPHISTLSLASIAAISAVEYVTLSDRWRRRLSAKWLAVVDSCWSTGGV